MSSRIAFATVLRSLPMRSAICVLRVAELVDQALVRGGLLERTEVGALEVLDERALERGRSRRRPARRPAPRGGRRAAPRASAARRRSGSSRRSRARAHDERHDHAVRPHRLGELGELRPRRSWRRGCSGLGYSSSMPAAKYVRGAIRRRPALRWRGAAARVGGSSAPSPRPSPRFFGSRASCAVTAHAAAPRARDERAIEELVGDREVARGAGAAQVVEQRGLAVARRLGQPHVARDRRRRTPCRRSACSTSSRTWFATDSRPSYIVNTHAVDREAAGCTPRAPSRSSSSAPTGPRARSTRPASARRRRRPRPAR